MTSLAPSERKELIQNAINFLTPKEGDDIRPLFMAAFCHLSSLRGDLLVEVLQRHPLGGNKHHAYFQRQRALPLTRARSFGETSTTGTFVKRGAVTSGRDISSIFMPMENIVDNADAGVTGDETGKTSPSVDGAAASVEETHGGNHTTKGSENESGRVTTDLPLVYTKEGRNQTREEMNLCWMAQLEMPMMRRSSPSRPKNKWSSKPPKMNLR